jgi:hypothetical protein
MLQYGDARELQDGFPVSGDASLTLNPFSLCNYLF